MEEDFLAFILNMYNEKFDHMFIRDCCQLKNKDNSKPTLYEIITNRCTFVACVKIRDPNGNVKTYHKFFPVMLGCKYHLDTYPHPNDSMYNCWGSFIIYGEVKILSNILVNNINLFIANHKQLLWNIDAQTQLIYKNGVLINGESCSNWRSYIKDENYIEHNEALYMKLFDEMWKYFPKIDHLSNKILLTAPVLLERVLLYLQSDEIVQKIATKRELLLNGNITFIFSKQPFTKRSSRITNHMAIEKKQVSIYISVDGHKLGRIKHLLTTTKRMIPQESMNSQPLHYPVDGDLFICMLSCKEMKDAGLTLNLAHRVRVTHAVNVDVEKMNLLQFFSVYNNVSDNTYYLVINCIIQNIKITFDFLTYLRLKTKFPNCSIFKYDTFIHVLFIENIPTVSIQWNDDGDVAYITPNENANMFKNELRGYFKLCDYFCALYKDLSPYTDNSLAPKKIVSLNNWRGACYSNIYGTTNTSEYITFLNSPGYNTEIVGGGKSYIHLAELKNTYLEDFPVDSSILKPYQNTRLPDQLNAQHGEILLYVGFGDLGECVEDGFSIDKEFTEHGPTANVVVNFNIKLTSVTNQQLNNRLLTNSKIQYIPRNQMIDKVIIFGTVITCGRVIKIADSKRIRIEETVIGNEVRYVISHVVENPLTTVYEISSSECFKKFSITASYVYNVKLGPGVKLCNSYGQKSEISKVRDLGRYCGKRIRDGAFIKPQIIMGAISVVSRTSSGQILDMLSSPDAALDRRGCLIAPVKFVVSSIISCTKIAKNPKRIDLLTGPNCFDGNQFTATNLLLNRQRNNNNQLPITRLYHSFNLMSYRGTQLRFITAKENDKQTNILPLDEGARFMGKVRTLSLNLKNFV